MNWKLWLDDQLDTVRPCPVGFTGAASSKEAMDLVLAHGPPEFMDLDCDLGGDDSAMKFLKWLHAEFGGEPPPDWSIHSRNVVERLNVQAYLSSWSRSLVK